MGVGRNRGTADYRHSYLMATTMADVAELSRSGGDQTVKSGTRVNVEIVVRNPSRWPLVWVLVEDLAPQTATESAGTMVPPITIDGQRLGVFLIPPGGSRTIAYEVHCRRRGYLQLGPTILETGDLLGLFRRFRVIGEPHYITVLPAVYPIENYEIGSRRPIGEIQLRERSMEDPTRLRGIRQWQIGDPMRSVHWAATARTGVLHTKVYEPSSIIGATIVIDMHCETNPAANEPVRLDLALSAAASIANYLHVSGEPFGFITNGRDAADRIRSQHRSAQTSDAAGNQSAQAFRRRRAASDSRAMADENDRLRPVVMPPDKTDVHYQAMIRTMARLERTEGLHLDELLIECESRMSSTNTLLIFVQIADERTLAAIISMKRRGRAVEVIANVSEIEAYSRVAAPLTAVGIAVHQLSNAESIRDLCRKMAVR